MAEHKKLIIDEDWKTQVEAEKRAAESQRQRANAAESSPAQDPQLPPASFELLVTTLATEAIASLGQVPHPATGQLHNQPQHAKYVIDTIDVLRQKTRGNLTPDEQQMIDGVLHQLRMAFVSAQGNTA
jgi:hypothetical protein